MHSPTGAAYTGLALSLVTLVLVILAVVAFAFAFTAMSRHRDNGQSSSSDSGTAAAVVPASVESWWIDGARHRRYLRSVQSETMNNARDVNNDQVDGDDSADDGDTSRSSTVRNEYDDWNLFVYTRHQQLPLSTAIETARNAMRRRRSDLIALGGVQPPSKADEQQVGDEDPTNRWSHVYWNEMSQQRRVAYQQGYWEVRHKMVYNGLDMSFAKITADSICYEALNKSPELPCSMYVRECARLSDGKSMLFVQFEQGVYSRGQYDVGYLQLVSMLTALVSSYPLHSWPMIIVGGFGVHGADRVLDDLLNRKFRATADGDGGGYHVPLFYRWPTYNGNEGVLATDAFAVSKDLYERVEYFVEFAENWLSPWSRIGARCFPRVDEKLAGTYDVTDYQYRLYADAVKKNANELRRTVLVGLKPNYDPSRVKTVDRLTTRLDKKFPS